MQTNYYKSNHVHITSQN